MDSKTNHLKNEKDYFNVIDKTSCNQSLEMKEIQLESLEKEQYNSEFVVKKTNSIELNYELGEFKLIKCKNVKSIYYKDQIFTSIANPNDDAHAFYILRNEKGIFAYNFNNLDFDTQSYQVKKREMLKDKIEEFLTKINSIVQIDWISNDLKKISFFKFLIYFLLFVFLIIVSYFSLLVLFYFIAYLIGSRKMEDSFLEKFFDVLCVFFSSLIIFVLFRYLKHFKHKEIFLLFSYILNKKKEIDSEFEYWNTSVFNPNSMKAQLSETFDYIQIFYDKSIVYEMEKHDFGTTHQLKENEINV